MFPAASRDIPKRLVEIAAVLQGALGIGLDAAQRLDQSSGRIGVVGHLSAPHHFVLLKEIAGAAPAISACSQENETPCYFAQYRECRATELMRLNRVFNAITPFPWPTTAGFPPHGDHSGRAPLPIAVGLIGVIAAAALMPMPPWELLNIGGVPRACRRPATTAWKRPEREGSRIRSGIQTPSRRSKGGQRLRPDRHRHRTGAVEIKHPELLPQRKGGATR